MTVILTTFIAIGVFFYHIGIGFGQATVKTIKSVQEATQEWQAEGVDPIDTLKTVIHDMLDSVEVNK